MTDYSGLVERLRERLVTVPAPGSEPFTPIGPIDMVIGGGPHKPGDSAGLQSVFNLTGYAMPGAPWKVQAHVYAGSPLEYEAAAAIEAQRKRIERLEGALKAALENDGGTAYSDDEDDTGYRVCCGVVSFNKHSAGCYVPAARAALEEKS